MPAMFSVHMVAHMLLSMLVPILLALGAPITMALRALPAAGKGKPPGPREWLLAALHSRVSRVLTHPIVALVLFVAGFYGLYFGGLFEAAVNDHAAHVLMNIHFLLSGYLFYWVVIGIDPTPRPLPRRPPAPPRRARSARRSSTPAASAGHSGTSARSRGPSRR